MTSPAAAATIVLGITAGMIGTIVGITFFVHWIKSRWLSEWRERHRRIAGVIDGFLLTALIWLLLFIFFSFSSKV